MGIRCTYLYLRRYQRRIILPAGDRDAASLQMTVLTNLRLAALVCQNGAAFPPTTLWSCSGDTEYMSRPMTTVLFYVRKSIVTNGKWQCHSDGAVESCERLGQLDDIIVRSSWPLYAVEWHPI